MPVITAIIDATPAMMPINVRNDRNLWDMIAAIDILKASIMLILYPLHLFFQTDINLFKGSKILKGFSLKFGILFLVL